MVHKKTDPEAAKGPKTAAAPANARPSYANVKGLMQDATELLDMRMIALRQSSRFSDVRPADAKVFMLVARRPRSISDLARALNISRQAVHASVGRLIDLGGIQLENAPGSKRDKIPQLTDLGREAQIEAAGYLKTIEAELAAKIGSERLEQLRAILIDILADPTDDNS